MNDKFKWIGERISIRDDKMKTSVVIYPEKKPLVTGLMGAWVAMWFAIGFMVIWAFFNLTLSDQEKVVLFVFMTFWCYYAFRVTRVFFWLLWGNELLKVDETAFVVKKSIRGYGRAIPYYLENIKKMEVGTPESGSIQSIWEASPWVKGGDCITFEYLGKPIRFGRKIQEKEAKLLYSIISKRIAEQLKRKTSKEISKSEQDSSSND